MLVLMFLIYADKYGHFECSVNFWQLLCLHVFWLLFDFCLFQKMDQRICIKFCVKNKIKCADAFRTLTVAYVVKLPWTEATFIGGTKCFPEGREDVNDEERAERPSTSTTDENIGEVKKIVLANRRITIREVAEDLNISIGSCPMIWACHGSTRNLYQNCSISTQNVWLKTTH